MGWRDTMTGGRYILLLAKSNRFFIVDLRVMTDGKIHTALNYSIAAVWIANGLFCKVLNLVPRHREIVAAILGQDHATLLTRTVGISETLMAVWIVSGIGPRVCTMTQILIIAVMNILEFLLVPDLLLWGRGNSFFAFLFIIVIWYNEFILRSRTVIQA